MKKPLMMMMMGKAMAQWPTKLAYILRLSVVMLLVKLLFLFCATIHRDTQ